jgi:hypothetical protein
LRSKLEPFDPVDLLATAGALGLLPENAERALRLQAFAQVVASLQIRENLPRISGSRLRQFLSGPELTGLASGEDPFPNAFVEEVPFFGGSYAVFPGTDSSAGYTFRMLSRAIFRDETLSRSLGPHVYSLIVGVLTLSKAIAARAGLHRGTAPVSTSSRSIILPGSDRLSLLKNAVSFAREDIEAFFGTGDLARRPWDRLQEGEVEDVLDRVGKHLRETCNVGEGPIPEPDRNYVLKEAVGFCYRELQQMVRSHRAEEFLEFLIREHEAVVRENAHRKLTIPTRIARFEMVEDIVQQLQEEFPKIAVASLASRFLVEYATTEPPNGFRPISLSSYDEMRALSNHIINFGMLSDAVRYELSDIKLAMLKSGRLGRTQGKYEGATASHMRETMIDTIAQAPGHFARNWPTHEVHTDPNELADALDVATLSEFGFAMTDLSKFIDAIRHVGEQLDPGVAAIDRDELIERLVGPLEWSNDRVDDALTLFSLGPRAKFLDAPPGGTLADVYPWRFNRTFSYLRRPLAVREGFAGAQILWGNRHLQTAHENLLSLCLTGRLKARTDSMRSFISRFRNKQALEFNDSVADVSLTVPLLEEASLNLNRFDRCRAFFAVISDLIHPSADGIAPNQPRVVWH